MGAGALALSGLSTLMTGLGPSAKFRLIRWISILCLSCNEGGMLTFLRHMATELPDLDTRKTKTSAVVAGSLFKKGMNEEI